MCKHTWTKKDASTCLPSKYNIVSVPPNNFEHNFNLEHKSIINYWGLVAKKRNLKYLATRINTHMPVAQNLRKSRRD